MAKNFISHYLIYILSEVLIYINQVLEKFINISKED